MVITTFGVIWITLNIIAIFNEYKYILTIMLLSCVFHASAVMLVGDMAISPWVFTSIFFIAKCVIIGSDKMERSVCIQYMIEFLVAYILITIIALIAFKDVPIPVEYKKNIGWTAVTPIYGGLVLTTKHVTDFIIYLLFVLDFICMARVKANVDIEYLKKIISCIMYFVLIVAAVQYIVLNLDLSTDLLERVIYSDISKQLAIRSEGYKNRIFSTFSEPSYCGLFFSAMFWFVLMMNNGRPKLVSVLLLAAVVLSLSSTAYGTFCVGGLIYLILIKDYRKVLLLIVLGIIAYIILNKLGYIEIIYNYILNKGESISGIERSAWNSTALDIFKRTHFWGIGMSSIRASSLALGLLAQVGIIGTLLFANGMYSIIKGGLSRKVAIEQRAASLLLMVVLAGQVIACPDLTFTVHWYAIFVVCLFTRYKYELKTKEYV